MDDVPITIIMADAISITMGDVLLITIIMADPMPICITMYDVMAITINMATPSPFA